MASVMPSQRTPKPSVAIIGGGWAGLSCAAELAEHRDLHITLLEAAPELGGRARGLIWNTSPKRDTTPSTESGSRWIDNGQHLTLGAYTATFDLLRKVGAPAWDAEPLRWSGVAANRNIQHDWQVPTIGWPWRVLSGVIPGRGPQGWPWSWKISVARSLLKLQLDHWQMNGCQTAHEWLFKQKAPHGLIEHFWRPLTEGALNTKLEEASARVLANVMRDSIGGGPGSTSVMQPRHNLSVDGVDPIAQHLRRHGVQIHTSRRVVRLSAGTTDQQAWCLECATTDSHDQPMTRDEFDQVVIALPFQSTHQLWLNSSFAPTPASQRWERLEPRAITTVWIALDKTQAKALNDLPTWFVFNPVHGVEHLAQVAVIREGILALVISAQQHPISKDDLRSALESQVLHQLQVDIRSLPQKWITEKKATWACTPDTPWPNDDEIQGLTGQTGIWRCADDLEPGYPATIESAVRSGKRTALRVRSVLSG